MKELEVNDALNNLQCRGNGVAQTIKNYSKTYTEYKAELDAELTKTAESFVRIGYLLKVARDTDILAESGYATVTDFAKAEYGIDKTQVSRFIHINDKFAEGGYSDHLLPSYQGYGYAKLTLMLSLPDAVNEGLSPNYSKAEIQSIKDEVDAESKVTDIERMLETTQQETQEQSRVELLMKQLACNEPELFVEIAKCLSDESWTIEDIKERMAPDGECTYSIRIPGEGRCMLMLSSEADARIVNVRTGQADTAGWGEIGKAWMTLMNFDMEPEKRWSELFCMPYPVRKAAVAPVQPQKQEKKPSKVVKAKPEKPKQETLHAVEPSIPVQDPVEPEPEEQESVAEQTEEDLPGQQDMETDYKEVMPENAINPPCEQELVPEKLTREQSMILTFIDQLAYDARRRNWKLIKHHTSQLYEYIKQIGGDDDE